MPEGDTIHYAANRIRPILAGEVPDELSTPHPRFRADRWPEKLAGRAVEAVEAHGKHLFLRFEGDLTIHSHLRMTGSWGRVVVQFDGPVLDLMTGLRARVDQRIAALGPDIVSDDFDEDVYLRRLREDDPTRPIGDALLDQRTLAGIGNLWKVEACFARGIDPWRVVGEVSDEEALGLVRWARPGMRESAANGTQSRFKRIYGTSGKPCPRCGTGISQRGQWDDNRPTYWCPGCQS